MAITIRGGVNIGVSVPLSISGLQLWLDANDSTTLFQDSAATTPASSDGDPIGCWKDKSGYARNATQTSGTNKPLLKTAVKNSKNIIRFNGSSNNITIQNSKSIFNFLYATQGTVFVIFQTNPSVADPNTIYALIDNCGIGASNGFTKFYDDRSGSGYNNTIRNLGGQYYGNYIVTSGNDAIPTGTWKIAVSKLRGQDATLAYRSVIYLNNLISASNNSQSGSYIGDASRDLTIGGAIDAWWLNGDIAEIIIYNLALNDSDRETVNNYLNKKWSIY